MNFPVQHDELTTLQYLIANYFPTKDAAQAQAVLSRLVSSAAIEAQGVPDGWQLVPKAPTDAMVRAALHLDLSYMPGHDGHDHAAVYKAMLASTPPAPQTERSGCTAGTDEECKHKHCAAQYPKQANKAQSDTMYLLRRLLSNQHTLTGSEFREELTKIVEQASEVQQAPTDKQLLSWELPEPAACGLMPLIEDYAAAVRTGSAGECAVLKKTIEASLEQLEAPQQASVVQQEPGMIDKDTQTMKLMGLVDAMIEADPERAERFIKSALAKNALSKRLAKKKEAQQAKPQPLSDEQLKQLLAAEYNRGWDDCEATHDGP